MTAKQRHRALDDYLGHIEEAATLANDYVRNMSKGKERRFPFFQQL